MYSYSFQRLLNNSIADEAPDHHVWSTGFMLGLRNYFLLVAIVAVGTLFFFLQNSFLFASICCCACKYLPVWSSIRDSFSRVPSCWELMLRSVTEVETRDLQISDCYLYNNLLHKGSCETRAVPWKLMLLGWGVLSVAIGIVWVYMSLESWKGKKYFWSSRREQFLCESLTGACWLVKWRELGAYLFWLKFLEFEVNPLNL